MFYNSMLSLPHVIGFSQSCLLLVVFLILLIITCLKFIFSKFLLENILLMSVFSMFISISYLLMDAPDVAMIEVALGACLSTCVWLNFIKISNFSKNQLQLSKLFYSSPVCLLFMIVFIWASTKITKYGLINAPVKQYVGKYYLENTANDMGLSSPITAILASYRGYDTLGETIVILIAGLAVLLILSLKQPANKKKFIKNFYR